MNHVSNSSDNNVDLDQFRTIDGELSNNLVNNNPVGSRIRDHLANERTYLAWMRTAIALLGFGVLIARLRYLVSPNIPGTGHGWAVGFMLACIGLMTVCLSTWHYFSVLNCIEGNVYTPNRRWVILFSMVVILMGAGVLVVLFSVPGTVKGMYA
jgi:putative membrane protein